MNPDLLGWASSIILVATLATQVQKQWRARTAAGVSQWLFLGEMAASAGFTVYSWLLRNWVFTVTNALGLVAAITGTVIFFRNRRLDRAAQAT